MRKDNHQHIHSSVDQEHPTLLTSKENVDDLNRTASVTEPNVPTGKNTVLHTVTVEIPDAEVDGRIVVKTWDTIAERGVFAVTSICAGEVLGVLQGVVVTRRRLTREERRRLIGIRVDGRAVHMDLQGRWPEMINHAPPSRCNADWNPDTREITAIADILPGQQVVWDYGPGFWSDTLINKDYDKLPKDEQAFFDVMHSTVDDYTWLIHAFRRQQKLGLSRRIAIIAIYLSQRSLGGNSTARFLGIDDASNGDQNMRCVSPGKPPSSVATGATPTASLRIHLILV